MRDRYRFFVHDDGTVETPGVDMGGKVTLAWRDGNKMIWREAASTCWSGRGCERTYCPATTSLWHVFKDGLGNERADRVVEVEHGSKGKGILAMMIEEASTVTFPEEQLPFHPAGDAATRRFNALRDRIKDRAKAILEAPATRAKRAPRPLPEGPLYRYRYDQHENALIKRELVRETPAFWFFNQPAKYRRGDRLDKVKKNLYAAPFGYYPTPEDALLAYREWAQGKVDGALEDAERWRQRIARAELVRVKE